MFLAHPVSFPFRVSLQHPLVSSLVSRGNSVEISWFGPQISQIGKIPGYFADFLGFASDFAPDQLSDSGKLESCQNGAPTSRVGRARRDGAREGRRGCSGRRRPYRPPAGAAAASAAAAGAAARAAGARLARRVLPSGSLEAAGRQYSFELCEPCARRGARGARPPGCQ